MTNVINTQKHVKIVIITSRQVQKGLMYMNGSETKETTTHANTGKETGHNGRKYPGMGKAHGSSLSKADAKMVTARDLARIRVEANNGRMAGSIGKIKAPRVSVKPVDNVKTVSKPEASSPNRAEQNRTNNAKHIIRKSQQTILHTSDMLAARNELGTLNLDYAEADKKMLEQAKKLQKRFG